MRNRFLGVLSVGGFALALTVDASAQEACGDSLCPKGWTCESEPTPCPSVDCAEGSDCPVCEPTSASTCRPGPCTSDSDCDPAMRCVTEQRSVCTGGTAPCAKPDGGEPDCPAPEPVECVIETVSACLPKYLGACERAADCGEGFTCEPVEQCSCGGSAGARPEDAPDGGGAFAPADGGADPVPPEDCECQPTDTNHCVLIETACTAATDCPSGWTCGENPEGVCSSGPDGSSCTPADPPLVCMPPFSDLGGGRGIGEDGNAEPDLPGGTDAGAEPPATSGSGHDHAAEDDGAMSSEHGGCTVNRASGAPSGALFGLALAALGLTLARRRR
jgi:hypothetical protein